MKILAVDDEAPALKALSEAINNVLPDTELYLYRDPLKAINDIEKGLRPDIIFADIRMYEMTGIQFAYKVKIIYPKTNIIFLTGYDGYMSEAIRLHASGYLLKPIDETSLKEQIDNLLYPTDSTQKGVYAQTFGNFEFFVNGQAVRFERSRSKELLAYLIDKRGASCTRAELLVDIFEDGVSEGANQGLSQAFFALMKTLKKYGIDNIIIKNRNSYAIDTSKINCDYYDYLNGDANAINSYQGRYMENYSNWSEFCGPKKNRF